jgi:hypothetical protein
VGLLVIDLDSQAGGPTDQDGQRLRSRSLIKEATCAAGQQD